VSRALHLPATFAKAGKSRPAGPESLAGGERKGTYGWLAVDAHGLADLLLVVVARPGPGPGPFSG
jgi:hypothetical protein